MVLAILIENLRSKHNICIELEIYNITSEENMYYCQALDPAQG